MPPVTPMMKQYFEIKKDYPNCILFYRLGDFYEMFFEDAKIASKELELVLTTYVRCAVSQLRRIYRETGEPWL